MPSLRPSSCRSGAGSDRHEPFLSFLKSLQACLALLRCGGAHTHGGSSWQHGGGGLTARVPCYALGKVRVGYPPLDANGGTRMIPRYAYL